MPLKALKLRRLQMLYFCPLDTILMCQIQYQDSACPSSLCKTYWCGSDICRYKLGPCCSSCQNVYYKAYTDIWESPLTGLRQGYFPYSRANADLWDDYAAYRVELYKHLWDDYDAYRIELHKHKGHSQSRSLQGCWCMPETKATCEQSSHQAPFHWFSFAKALLVISNLSLIGG